MWTLNFKQSLSIALILSGLVLVWNAYESPNLFISEKKSNEFSASVSKDAFGENGLVSLSNYRPTFVSQISNMRLNTTLDSALPKDSCVQAYAQSGQKFRIDPIVNKQSGTAYAPASTNKYITAAIALTVFNKNDTLDTELFSESKNENVKRAYVKTSGDPSFVSVKTPSPRRPAYLSPENTRTFMDFAINISKSGVKNIDELVIDTKWFDLPQVERGWEKDKLQVGQISALNIDEGFEGAELSENPNLYAAQVLVNSMAQQGVSVGKIVESEIPAEVQKKENRIGLSSSPTIETIVSDMLKTSDNVYAEQILAVAVRTDNAKVDIDSRKNFVTEQLQDLGIELSGFVFENGSGYSKDARLSCEQENQIIKKMKEKGVDLTNLASIAGVDGTLENRFTGFSNKLRAKTGTLDNVSALSGKLEQRFVFTFIANSQFSLEQGHGLQEVVVGALDAYPYVEQPNFG